MQFFHSSIHFRKLKLCMVNNSDKRKVFCKNDFHVGGVTYFLMSAYEPKHHSVIGCLQFLWLLTLKEAEFYMPNSMQHDPLQKMAEKRIKI